MGTIIIKKWTVATVPSSILYSRLSEYSKWIRMADWWSVTRVSSHY